MKMPTKQGRLQGRYQLSLWSPHPQVTPISVFTSQHCRFIGSLDYFRAGQSNMQKGTKAVENPSFPSILIWTVSLQSTMLGRAGRYLCTLASTQVIHSDPSGFCESMAIFTFGRKNSVRIQKSGSHGLCTENPSLSPSHCLLCVKELSKLDVLSKLKLGPLNFISNFLLC